MLEQPVGLADQLHVAVLDAVVNHFHVVPGATRPHPIAARNVALWANLRRDCLEDWLHERPASGRAARHQAGALERAFLAAGNTRANVEQPACLNFSRAAFGVGVERVAAVDNDIARGEQGSEMGDEVVDRWPSLHHHHDLARSLNRRDEVFQRVAADNIRLFSTMGREGVCDGGGAIVDGDGIAAASDIECEVFAHDRQADQSDITRCWLVHATNAPEDSF